MPPAENIMCNSKKCFMFHVCVPEKPLFHARLPSPPEKLLFHALLPKPPSFHTEYYKLLKSKFESELKSKLDIVPEHSMSAAFEVIIVVSSLLNT